MTKKKGKLMTFFWSLIPGAGEMYLGFFKQGVSLMSAFAILLGISGFLQLGFLTFLSPIVWFYSFFHANNLNSLSDEEFYSIEDDYILHWSDIVRNRNLIRKYQKLLAACLIFFGISILWNITSSIFWYLMPHLNLSQAAMDFLNFAERSIPQLVVAVLIILVGISLIKGKYEELQDENNDIPLPPYLEQNSESHS